jgi:cellulose synthase/poly-beta-1,6-N-acetylglucosamine synthase-like glycosyltransferase
MNILFFLFLLIQAVIALYFLQPLTLFIIHYAKRLLKPYQSPVSKKPALEKDFDFAAIVTAHKDTRFIPPLVDSLLKQQYKNFHIYIVADGCDISSLHFNADNVSLLKPEKDFNAKIKSIRYAVDHFARSHDALVIFDSDNLVHPDYFAVLNKYFQQGYKAVQTQMLSKNTETVYARLDTIGHVYYTFLERQMRMELGLSSHILGLGIAVDLNLYNEIMYKDRLGGFDKKLQADIVKRIPQLAYAAEAMVYDEKVDDGKTMEKQRTRWLFTYFHYFGTQLNLLFTGVKKFSFNLIYFGFIALRPPMIILTGLAVLFGVLNLFIMPMLSIVWAALLLLFAAGFVLIVLTQSRQKGTATAVFSIPAMMIRQLKALLKIKQARKTFLKTEHSKVLYIEDILKNEPV